MFAAKALFCEKRKKYADNFCGQENLNDYLTRKYGILHAEDSGLRYDGEKTRVVR